MAQTKNKYQIIQKVSNENTVLLHPETEAGVVEFDNTTSQLSATTVQDAIDEIVTEHAGVTGVKGNAETSYRTGNVNLTPANIGAEEAGAVDTHNTDTSAHGDIRTAVSTAQSRADEAYALAEGKSKGVGYENIQAFITAFNSLEKSKHNVGDSIYIQTIGVPDFWVYEVENTSSTYTYTTDDAFINAVKQSGSVQVGYFKVSISEGDKVDLSEYQKINDNTLQTTNKTVPGAINEVKGTAGSALTKATTNESAIEDIVDGTTKVAKATHADSADASTTADKWTTARTIGVTVGSGNKSDGSTAITGTGSQSIDGSANKTITLNLGDSGVSAGTYSAVQVNAKGIAVAGGQIIEVGTSGQTQPSASLATGGLFFKLII